jgi:hypothetical protein
MGYGKGWRWLYGKGLREAAIAQTRTARGYLEGYVCIYRGESGENVREEGS